MFKVKIIKADSYIIIYIKEINNCLIINNFDKSIEWNQVEMSEKFLLHLAKSQSEEEYLRIRQVISS